MKTEERNKIVGVKAVTYPELRNFVGTPVTGFQYEKKLDYYKILNHFYFKLKKKPHPRWSNLFRDFNLGSYDLLHFFNAVNCGSKPWISTFEYYLPRGAHGFNEVISEKKYIKHVLDRLNHQSCKKLLALSDFAFQAQQSYLDDAKQGGIIHKIEVLHPPQKLIVEKIEDKIENEKLELLMVGADFFRKGGKEVLAALEILEAKGYRVHLTIVSRLHYGDYASLSTEQDYKKALGLILNNQNITWYETAENSKVIELFRNTDIALLPSYDETYGYTVLEAQAAGCPVITTNGAAMSEINNNECGWLLEVDLFENKRSVPRTPNSRIKFESTVRDGIVDIIEDCIRYPELVRKKGAKALQRIIQEHDPIVHARRLEEIYKKALNG